MSTKIYTGIRIRREDLDRYIVWYHEYCLEVAVGFVKKVMSAVTDEEAVTRKMLKHEGARGKMSAEEFVKDEKMRNLYKCSSAFLFCIATGDKGIRAGNINSWFNMFPFKQWFYIVPEYPICQNPQSYPDFIEEYGYWNNTDKPEGMSDLNWDSRWMEWGYIMDNWDSLRICHKYIDLDEWNITGLNLIAEKILGKGDGNLSPEFMASWDYREAKERMNKNKEEETL